VALPLATRPKRKYIPAKCRLDLGKSSISLSILAISLINMFHSRRAKTQSATSTASLPEIVAHPTPSTLLLNIVDAVPLRILCSAS